MTHYEQIFGIYEPKTSSGYRSIACGGPNNGNSILGRSLDGGLHEDLDLTNHGERLRRHFRGEIEPYLPARIRQDGVVRQAAGTRHHPRGFPSRGADQDRHRVATSSRPTRTVMLRLCRV
jgi:hypothetical protein